MADDPFDALALPPKFDLELGTIQRAYLARVAATHPDLAADEQAEVQSANLNQAKSILENPERRANALLARLGGPGKDVDKSLPDGFLLAIMEIREAIEEAIASKGEAERGRWETWAQEQREDYRRRVGALFQGVAASGDAGTLRAIRQVLNAWRYVERLIEQLDPHYDPGQRDFVD